MDAQISSSVSRPAVEWNRATPTKAKSGSAKQPAAARRSLQKLDTDFSREIKPLKGSLVSKLSPSKISSGLRTVFKKTLGKVGKKSSEKPAVRIGAQKREEAALFKEINEKMMGRQNFTKHLQDLQGSFGKALEMKTTLKGGALEVVKATASFLDIPTSSKAGRRKAECRNTWLHNIATSLDTIQGVEGQASVSLRDRVLGSYTVGKEGLSSDGNYVGPDKKALKLTCIHLETIIKSCDDLVNGFTTEYKGKTVNIPGLKDGATKENLLQMKTYAENLKAQLEQDFDLPKDEG